MAHIVALSGGIGGVSCAYELKNAIRKEDRVTLVSNKSFFQFTPSNPWVAVKWRTKSDIIIDLATVLPKHGVAFNGTGAARVHPAENRVELGNSSSVDYDYLVVATGPELRQLGVQGPLGPRRQGGVREILPAQGLRRRDRAVFREDGDEVFSISARSSA